MPAPEPCPKIELHVHLEGTVRPDTLRAIAGRNDYALPADLESLYRFRDFAHFIEVWILTTNALRAAEDFRQVVTDYAEEAATPSASSVASAGTRSSAATATAPRRRSSCTASRCG
jgi:aminodeoxyfutalosine deaminase